MSADRIVFVTGVGGCGVGEGVAKAVLGCSGKYRLWCGNADRDAPLLYRAERAFVLPPGKSPFYMDTIFEICHRDSVDILIPGSEAELRVLCHYRRELKELGTILISSAPEVIAMADDKWATHEFLLRHGFPAPASSLEPVTREFLELAGFPLILKPRLEGRASKDVHIARDETDLNFLLQYFQYKGIQPLLQEYVGEAGEEYTVSVVIGSEQRVLGSIAMRRNLLGGFSQRVEVEDFVEIRSQCEQIAGELQGAFGPINVQLRWVKDRVIPFEINPRFSGTTPFRALAGFNEVEILLGHVLYGLEPQYRIQTGVVGIRAFEETMIPLQQFQSVPEDCTSKVMKQKV